MIAESLIRCQRLRKPTESKGQQNRLPSTSQSILLLQKTISTFRRVAKRRPGWPAKDDRDENVDGEKSAKRMPSLGGTLLSCRIVFPEFRTCRHSQGGKKAPGTAKKTKNDWHHTPPSLKVFLDDPRRLPAVRFPFSTREIDLHRPGTISCQRKSVSESVLPVSH